MLGWHVVPVKIKWKPTEMYCITRWLINKICFYITKSAETRELERTKLKRPPLQGGLIKVSTNSTFTSGPLPPDYSLTHWKCTFESMWLGHSIFHPYRRPRSFKPISFSEKRSKLSWKKVILKTNTFHMGISMEMNGPQRTACLAKEYINSHININNQ